MRVFLSKKEKRKYHRNLRLKLYFIFGATLILAVLAVYGMLNASFLQIKNFEVSGKVSLDEAQAEILKGTFARILGFKNFLAWPRKLGDIQVGRDFSSGTLRLTGIYPEKFAIWCASECLWVSAKGQIIDSAPDTEGSSIPKITGGAIPDEKLFSNIVGVIDGLNRLPIRIENFEFNDRLQELTAKGTKGERLIFSARFTPQEKAFNYLRDLALKGELRSAEYVDLTVENRIYLKPR